MTMPQPDRRTHLDPIVDSERERGNRVVHGWTLDKSGDLELVLRHPLDLAAVAAEFDLPDSIRLTEHPDGSTSVADNRTRIGVRGGPGRIGRAARAARRSWWQEWTDRPRPLRPIKT